MFTHKLIGRGADGEVHLVSQGDKHYIQKVPYTLEGIPESEKEQQIHEIIKQRGHKARGLVPAVDAARPRGHVVAEYVEGEELYNFLRNLSAYTPRQREEVISMLRTAVKSFHDLGWAHLDIHPGNVMYSKRDHKVYLIDYGRAQPIDVTYDNIAHVYNGTWGTAHLINELRRQKTKAILEDEAALFALESMIRNGQAISEKKAQKILTDIVRDHALQSLNIPPPRPIIVQPLVSKKSTKYSAGLPPNPFASVKKKSVKKYSAGLPPNPFL